MINVSDLSKSYGGRTLFRHATFQLLPGHRYGLVGANGTGKSTLLRLLIGEEEVDTGVVVVGRDLTVATLKQNHYEYERETILNTVLRGMVPLWNALERKEQLLKEEREDDAYCHELAEIEKVLETYQGYSAEGRASKLLTGLGLEESVHRQPMSVLSGGYKLRVLLAQSLFSNPDVLLLDEPNNHLDIVSIRWLEQYLRQSEGVVVVSSHDRDFLNSVCTDILDLDYGTIKLYPGNYDSFLEAKVHDRELQQALLSKQEKRREDMQGFVDRFRAKASKARQAQTRVRMIEKLEEEMEALDLQPSSRGYPNLRFSMERPSGVIALRARHLQKAYGQRRVLEGVSFEVERGERIGIIGPNGIGKSTLLKILTSTIPADGGEHEWGHATSVAYFSQDHDSLVTGSSSLLDWLWAVAPTETEQSLRDVLGRVLFSGDDAKQKVSSLSGGEKARLVLARMMLQKSNVLLFDEPTNHLDMEAIEALIEALNDFQGTLLFVSHNVHFVSKLAGRIWELQRDGLRDYRGTYSEYLAQFGTDFLSKDEMTRAAKVTTQSPKASVNELDIETRRKQRNRRKQLQREIETLEKRSDEVSTEIAKAEEMMSQEGFYLRDSQEVQRIVREKELLEKSAHELLAQWETAVRDLDALGVADDS